MKTLFLLLIPFLVNTETPSDLKQNTDFTYSIQYEEINAEKIYKKRCKWCHGPDGSKTKRGVASLALSQLSVEEKTDIIANGKGTMPPFGMVLSESEVEAVANFVGSFTNP